MSRARQAVPRAVVVGAASRDIAAGDPRGWRLGGGVSYSALTMARLGLPTGAIIGVDADAAGAWELELLRSAGVDVRIVPLGSGPVFENLEGPGGRVQLVRSASDDVPVGAVPDPWRAAAGWIFAPVAAELPEAWARLPATDAFVAVGWQGLLRRLVPGQRIARIAPGPAPLIARAEVVGLSREDVDAGLPIAELLGLVKPRATLVLTQGDRGGIVGERSERRPRLVRYPALPASRIVDPTGAGDVFLAALAALRIEPSLIGRGGTSVERAELLVAAAAASLAVEDEGLLGVPDRDRLRQRINEARPTTGAARSRPATPD